jgi:hypothetical protein
MPNYNSKRVTWYYGLVPTPAICRSQTPVPRVPDITSCRTPPPPDSTRPPQPHAASKPMHNAPINVMCSIMMKEVVSAASEAKLGGLFHNDGKAACPIRICLTELCHPQPPTLLLKTDNTTAEGLANDTVKQKRSIIINMRFYSSGSISCLLAQSRIQPSGLLHQTSCHQISSKHAAQILTTPKQSRLQPNFYEAPTSGDDWCDAKIVNLNPELHFAPQVQICLSIQWAAILTPFPYVRVC